MRNSDDRLINTDVGNPYFQLVLFLVTASGAMYVFNILPAYDPSVLAQPTGLTYVEYLFLGIGGAIIYISFVFMNRVAALYIQLIGLLVQGLAALTTSITVTLFAGVKLSLFILLFGVTVMAMHSLRIRLVHREIKNAFLKREIASQTLTMPTPASVNTHGDLILQALRALQTQNEQLSTQLRDRPLKRG